MKSIHIEGCEWKYKVGKQNTVICPPDGRKFHVGNHELKGFPNPDTFDRGKWKKTSDGMVMPSDVKRYLISRSL